MRDDSAQRIRLAMDAFISVLLWCVNKRKEPPRAAAPIGVANIVGFSWHPKIQVATNGLPDSAGSVSLSPENARAAGVANNVGFSVDPPIQPGYEWLPTSPI
jgi:hypothetical protein